MISKREKLIKLFHDIDVNSDGVLSSDEISYYLNHHGYTQEQIQGFWQTFDLNRDGIVTLPEFYVYLNSLGYKNEVSSTRIDSKKYGHVDQGSQTASRNISRPKLNLVNCNQEVEPDGSSENLRFTERANNTPERTRSGYILDESKIRAIFNYFDKNNSGRLEFTEVKDLLARLGSGEGDEFLAKWLGTGENSGLTCDDILNFLKLT